MATTAIVLGVGHKPPRTRAPLGPKPPPGQKPPSPLLPSQNKLMPQPKAAHNPFIYTLDNILVPGWVKKFYFCGNISLYRSIVRPGGLIFPIMLPFINNNVPINQIICLW